MQNLILKHAFKIGALFSLLALFGPATVQAEADPIPYKKHWFQNLNRDVKEDFSQYTRPSNLKVLGDIFIGAAVLANTGLDRTVANHAQKDIQSPKTDRFFKLPMKIGCLSFYYAPLFLGTMWVGHLRDHTPVGNVLYHWGYRSFRTFMLGGLQQVVMTNVLGSGRPNLQQESKWQPFRHQTGVSGHAFYGAIPLLSAAFMTDPKPLRYGLFMLSTLPGLSRINCNRHYLSQVVLGWSLAYLSAKSVYRSDETREPRYQISVQPRSDGAMLAARLAF